MYKLAGHTHQRIKERLNLPASKADLVQLKAKQMWHEGKLKDKFTSSKLYAPVVSEDKQLGYALFKPHKENLILTTFYSKQMKPRGMNIGNIKLAAKKKDMPLKPYQQRVIDRISDPKQPGLVVAHEPGLGKSLSGIGAYQKLNMPTNVIVPAALQENYKKEFRKWMGHVPNNVNIVSQQRLANTTLNTRTSPNSLDIIDESQAARNPDSNLLNALAKLKAKKRLLLTGTPLVNGPENLSTLVNLAAGKNLLPTSKAEFANKYVEQEDIAPPLIQRLFGVKPGIGYSLKNKEHLQKVFNKYVDYQQNTHEGYPSVKYQDVKVPMGDHQMAIYKTLMNQAPYWTRFKVKTGLPPGKGELDKLQSFLTGVRQVSNSTEGFTTRKREIESPKIQQAFNYFKQQLDQNPNYKAVVYNNYIESGIDPYKKLLEKHNIPYGEFSGRVTATARNQAVKDYNANKLKALLITQAGAEGLDLKKTRLIQLLSSHFNNARMKQIEGRGARYMSHAGLPPAQQNMLVQRYFATPQQSWVDKLLGNKNVKGVDEYIYNIANQKDKVNNEIMSLLRNNPYNQQKKKLMF